MHLTKRQFDILKYLIDNYNKYVLTIELAKKFNVSKRTIINDLYYIKIFVEKFNTFNLESIPSKGIMVKVKNKDSFLSEILTITNQEIPIIDYDENQRNISMLKFFLNTKGYISKERILNTFYISESLFYKIYKTIKETLMPYNLSIQYSKNSGYIILGNEKDKRSFIAKYELLGQYNKIFNFDSDISDIYDFIADLFIKYEYKITEQILQNISAHVSLMKMRVKEGHFIESFTSNISKSKIEYKISKEICEKFISNYRLDENYFNNEVLLLTQNILGKINYSIDENKQKEINDFITDCFKKIKQEFNINFESNERLRLFLVLHLVPLIYRIKSGTQLSNFSANEIRQQFPYANDISLYFSILFEQKFGYTISSDELSYIALYFNYGIEELNLAKSSKRLLIITKLRNSETVLLRHKLLTWFPNQIIDITFIHPEIDINNVDFEEYDAIFATELFSSEYKNAVTLINTFPNEHDFKKINLALNGFSNTDDIIDKFNKNCFIHGNFESKEEVLKFMCDCSIKQYNLDKDFFNHIYSREKISSTFFNDNIAMPHTLSPISDQTFITVAILDKPIKWDSSHFVKLILLISIEKNNPRAFQLWYYLSDLIRSNKKIDELMKQKTFDDFIKVLKDLLEKV